MPYSVCVCVISKQCGGKLSSLPEWWAGGDCVCWGRTLLRARCVNVTQQQPTTARETVRAQRGDGAARNAV